MVLTVDVAAPIVADVLKQALKVLPPGLQAVATSIRIGDTFEVWTLPNFSQSGNDILTVAVQTGSLHHQLLVTNDPVGFVRSRAAATSTTREVTQVAKSRLAARIEESVAQAGPHVSNSVPARLVVASAYRLFAFWFPDIAQVYVISCPATYHAVTPNELLVSTDFMTRLHSEQPVAGVTIV